VLDAKQRRLVEANKREEGVGTTGVAVIAVRRKLEGPAITYPRGISDKAGLADSSLIFLASIICQKVIKASTAAIITDAQPRSIEYW